MIDDPRILRIQTVEDMMAILKEHGRPLSSFQKGDTVHVWNKMRRGYEYTLEEAPGQGMAAEFNPWADPGEMLALGVFEGKYLNDCVLEFPAEWFLRAGALGKLRPGVEGSSEGPSVEVNGMQADSRLPLSEWRRKGWVPGGAKKTGILADPSRNPDEPSGKSPRAAPASRAGILADPSRNPDERGWFQWYCRYWLGRRIPELDAEQIGRWRAFKRHAGQVKANCRAGDTSCRPRQRQALLQWSWNPFL
jgi:hypothetical protein